MSILNTRVYSSILNRVNTHKYSFTTLGRTAPGRAVRMDGLGLVFDGPKRAFSKKKIAVLRAIESNKKYTKFDFLYHYMQR